MIRLFALFASVACIVAAPFDIRSLSKQSNPAIDHLKLYQQSSHRSSNQSIKDVNDTPVWKLMTSAAAWEERAGGSVYYNSATRSFILHGIGIYDQDQDSVVLEVWSSTDGMQWSQVKPRSVYSALFSPLTTIADGAIFRVQGSDTERNPSPDVYMSTNNGMTWISQHTKSRSPLPGIRYLGSMVALQSSPTTLFACGGQTSNDVLGDCYRSDNSGIDWKLMSNDGRNVFEPRSLSNMLSTTVMLNGVQTDVIYQMAGYLRYDSKTGRGIYANDMWFSYGSTIGEKWVPMPNDVPWSVRGDAYAGFTSTGVMVVSGGMAHDFELTVFLKDVWASLDGGYSWGQCAKTAEYSDRTFEFTTLDADGYLWVMGGRQDDGYRTNDVWRTVNSFNDAKAVAIMCNLLVPTCGIGLKCLPSSPGFRTGLWGVTCDACPNPPGPPKAQTE